MKKKLLLGLVTFSAASMLCGFDSAETVDSLSEKMQEASASVAGATADLTMNVDAAINISDGTTDSSLGLSLKGGFGYDISMDPIAMKMDGTMNVSAMGQNEDMALQVYAVPDESGVLKTYSYVKDSTSGEEGWTVESADGLNINELMEASKDMSMNFSDLADWGLTFELAPEAADVDGTECYLLSTTIDSDSLNTLMQKSSEITGQDVTSDENVGMVLSMLTGLNLKLEYYIDTATYMPVKIHMDMNDSDFSVISTLLNAYLGSAASEDAPASTVELTVNDISLDMATNYGAAPEITVPQEALDAEASGEAESLEDLVGSAVEG
ncbi:MAG: hypothetical protein Q4C61_15765 [Lachnospiraceae bacterium]|nr:hypothetical protein [Lachnospiraceae bacterium]